MTETASANPQTTQLMPDLMATTTFAGDSNMTAATVFTVFNQMLWTSIVSLTNPNCVLARDVSLGHVTIRAGAMVSLRLAGATEMVEFTGLVIDAGVETSLTNQMLAEANVPAEAKAAEAPGP